MSLSDLLPKGKEQKGKKEVETIENSISKLINLPEWAVDEIALIAFSDKTRDKRKRNFKNFVEDLLIKVAQDSIDKK